MSNLFYYIFVWPFETIFKVIGFACNAILYTVCAAITIVIGGAVIAFIGYWLIALVGGAYMIFHPFIDHWLK
jgi:hypothetical protein